MPLAFSPSTRTLRRVYFWLSLHRDAPFLSEGTQDGVPEPRVDISIKQVARCYQMKVSFEVIEGIVGFLVVVAVLVFVIVADNERHR